MSVHNVTIGQEEFWKKKEKRMVEPRYCPKVRMGNWREELILQEEKIKQFLRKKEKGDLLVQRTRAMFTNLLKEVQLLQPGCVNLAYGQSCQVLATSLCHPRAPRGLALAGVAAPKDVDACQHFQDGSLISATPLIKPVVRNCFRICSLNRKFKDGQPLNYGNPFALAILESPYGIPLFVESEIPHLHSILGDSKHPLLRLSSYRNIYSLWKVVPLDPATRPDLWDTPVPVNTPVIITHVASNKNLALEPSFWFPTYFGVESEVSVHTYLNLYRRETENNIWVLANNRPNEHDDWVPAQQTDVLHRPPVVSWTSSPPMEDAAHTVNVNTVKYIGNSTTLTSRPSGTN